MGLLFTLLGGGMSAAFLFAGGPFWEDWTIDARGVPATAMPDGVRPTNTRINRRTVHEISFHYLDAEGIPHSGISSTADGRFIEAAARSRAARFSAADLRTSSVTLVRNTAPVTPAEAAARRIPKCPIWGVLGIVSWQRRRRKRCMLLPPFLKYHA